MSRQAKPIEVATLRNRIVRHADVDPSTLTPNPANWRLHPENQHQAIGGILDAVGFVQSVLVNERTGRMIDGHLRVRVAMEQGAATVPVSFVDLSEEEERLVLASLDPLGSMAVADEDKLAELLSGGAKVNTAFDQMISSLLDQSQLMAPAEVGEDGKADAPGAARAPNTKHHIRPVLLASQVQTLERALDKTGLLNRADAFMVICEEYLSGKAKG